MTYLLTPRQRLRVLSLVVMGGVVGCFAALSPTMYAQEPANLPRVHQVFAHPLPQLDGGHLRVIMRLVTYAPGEGAPPHSHPCPVIGYVLEGALRVHIKGSNETIYNVGETFFEAPNSFHQTTKNASDTKPARLLSYFICDHEGPLTTPFKTKDSAPSR